MTTVAIVTVIKATVAIVAVTIETAVIHMYLVFLIINVIKYKIKVGIGIIL